MNLNQQELELHYQLGRKHSRKENLIIGFILGLFIGVASCVGYWFYLSSLS